MQPIQLFDLASRQAHWLSVRQSVVAGNIANANTPGYKAKDVEPFQAVLAATGNRMAATAPGHFVEDELRSAVKPAAESDDLEVKTSGNSVGLPEELIKAGDIKRQFELNLGLVKSFHQMMLMTVRKS